MTTTLWKTRLETDQHELASLAQLPAALAAHEALPAMAAICALGTATLSVRLTPNSARASVTARSHRAPTRVVTSMLLSASNEVSDAVLGDHHSRAASPRAWLDCHGFEDLVLQMVEARVQHDAQGEMIAHVARRAVQATNAVQAAKATYVRQILARDLPDLLKAHGEHVDRHRRGDLCKVIKWVLQARDTKATPRPIAMARRLRALETYGVVAAELMSPAVEVLVDAGEPIGPCLERNLSLTAPMVRALRNILSLQHLLLNEPDWWPSVAYYRDHEIPLNQWPGQGRPGSHNAWKAAMQRNDQPFSKLLRRDYHGADSTHAADAINGFVRDILQPIMSQRLSLRENVSSYQRHLCRQIEATYFGRGLSELTPRQSTGWVDLLRLVRTLAARNREPAAFDQAVEKWHRRAATVAAIRNEAQTDLPGWPALCPPWTSSCGTYSVVALTTADELMEEGNHHNHCVGGYYDTCRGGDTQILSLREIGVPMATVEVLLSEDIKHPSMRVGQFKGRNDAPAEPQYHTVLRAFLADLRSGAHPTNHRKVAAYRKTATERVTWDQGQVLSMDHARKAYPLYRALLPKGSPDSLDEWIAANDVERGIDAVLDLVSD